MNASRRKLRPRPARRQRGAVLYIALILLILLSLLGIAGVQVASMQEKMSASWRASNLSFQNAETQNRAREQAIAAAPAAVSPDDTHCVAFDAGEWAETELSAGDMTGVHVKEIGTCSGGASERFSNTPINDNTDLQFQVTSFATDEVVITDDATSESVVDTIFIP